MYENIRKILDSKQNDDEKGAKIRRLVVYKKTEAGNKIYAKKKESLLTNILYKLFECYICEDLSYELQVKYTRIVLENFERDKLIEKDIWIQLAQEKEYIEIEEELSNFTKTYKKFNLDEIVEKLKIILNLDLNDNLKCEKIRNFFIDENYQVKTSYPIIKTIYKINHYYPYQLLPSKDMIKYVNKIIEDYQNDELNYYEILKEIRNEKGLKRAWKELVSKKNS